MNEEILKNAKFFLFQHAEKVSDTLALVKLNKENDIKVSKQLKMDEDYRQELFTRISLADGKISIREKHLKQIDECIRYLDSLVK